MSTRHSRSRTASRLAVVVIAASAVLSAGPSVGAHQAGGSSTTGSAGTSSGTPTTVPGQGVAAARQVDVARASRNEVRAEVAAIDGRMKEQYQQLVMSRAAAEEGMQRAARAQGRSEAAERGADKARDEVRDYAVEAFIRPPSQDALAAMSVSDMDDAAFVSDVLGIVADERRQVVDVMVSAQTRASREQAEAEQVAAQARDRADQADDKLQSLEQVRDQQSQLASEMDQRLESALAESDSLKAIDAKAAADLKEQEQALRATTVASAPTRSAAPRVATSNTSPPTAAPSGSGPAPAPVTTRPPAPTGPPPPPPTGIVTSAEVTRVGGILVNKSIAGQVQGLLNAATAAGFSLSGGGFRDPASQIILRQAHCGPSSYAVYEMPASQCTPPTARPGTSMHERGLAIDFQSSGRLITSRSDPAFQWLAANASRFGLFNLPSEPWHWSTNGN